MKARLLYAAMSTAVVAALAGGGIAASGTSASSAPADDYAGAQRAGIADDRTGLADRTRALDLAPAQLQVDFAGTVALSNCSGSLVRFAASQPTDPAMALTNGHCYEGGFMEPGEVHVDEPSNRSMTLLDAGGGDAGTLQASSIAYGTMTDTDVLLYELNQTYAEVEQTTGVPALTLAAEEPAVGADISVVSGYWQEIYTCAVDGYVYLLHEAEWTWKGSTRYTQPGCEVIGGTSGSPVIRHDTGEVSAINNTTNENGERCTLNNPCEETEAGEIIFEQGRSYAQQTTVFYTCLTAEREIDLTLEGCLLPDPA
jgi:V8-like Glu-specific endopeptidase